MTSTGTAARLADPYRVKAGDTLSAIARRSGRSLTDLQRFNKISNPNRLEVGQVLYLSEESAFGVSVLFLDALRHPIQNLPFRVHFDGKVVSGTTGTQGTVPRQVTQNAASRVEIWIQSAEQRWERVTQVASDYGHKLITLVSPALVIPGKTEPHPSGAPIIPKVAKPPESSPAKANERGAAAQPPMPQPATGTPIKNNPAVKTKKAKAPQGQSVVKISVDIPKDLLELFSEYKGGEISEANWDTVAAFLECEKEVLKAISKVESGGKSAYWRLNSGDGANIPAILFERHYFSRLTGKKFDRDHPDISWPTGYRTKRQLGKEDNKMHDGKVDADDVYSDYASAYLRLINAYRLDAVAALQSCSWGKFQVMGANFSACGSPDTKTFVKSMCRNELGQVDLLAGFIRRKPRAWKNPKNKALGKEISLWDAVKQKNWRAIAFNYNGPSYETYSYHTKLEAAYDSYKKSA